MKIKNIASSGRSERPTQTGNSDDVETLAAFARRLNVARSTVTRAAQAGRLVLDAAGQVLIQASLASWHATAGARPDVAQRHAQARGAAIPPATAAQTAQTGLEFGGEGEGQGTAADEPTGPTRADLEAEKLKWENKLLLLALDVDTGAKLPLDALLTEAHGLGGTLRATVDRLVDQTSPRLAAAAASPDDQARLLGRERIRTRRALQVAFIRALRRLKPQRNPETTP